MAIKYTVVHRKDVNNVGDMASNPLQYFLKKDEYEVIDIVDYARTRRTPDIPVIVGGGGLIQNEFFGDVIRSVLNSSDLNQLANMSNELWKLSSGSNQQIRDEFFAKLNPLIKEYSDKIAQDKTPKIIWGAGHNGTYQKKLKGYLEYPEWLTQFDMVGIRDHGQQFEYVPCASCMHPALQKKYPIKNDVIWFEHKKQLIKSTEFGSKPVPRFVNSGNNMDQTIELLGSANIIVTNSYHGAYWGTLLGRKVIVVEAWSSKFNSMKFSPYFLGKGEDWESIRDAVPSYPNALEDSIKITQKYWQRIQEIS